MSTNTDRETDTLISLTSLALDSTAERIERVRATQALERLRDAQVPGLLARLVSDADPAVAAAAASALGRAATDTTQLELLARLGRGSSVLADRARFAATLIAHRFDVAGHDPQPLAAFVPQPLEAGALQASVTAASTQERAIARTSLQQTHPELAFDGIALQLQCRQRVYLMLGTSDAAQAFAQPALLLQRRWQIGQLAIRSPVEAQYAPGLTILSTPSTDGATLGLYRGDGALSYAGSGRLESGVFVASLAAKLRPGARAIAGTVRLSTAGLELQLRSATRRAAPRSPTLARRA